MLFIYYVDCSENIQIIYGFVDTYVLLGATVAPSAAVGGLLGICGDYCCKYLCPSSDVDTAGIQ